MSLININADFSRLCSILERIADALERAYPVPRVHEVKRVEPEDIVTFSEKKAWEEQQEERYRQSLPLQSLRQG